MVSTRRNSAHRKSPPPLASMTRTYKRPRPSYRDSPSSTFMKNEQRKNKGRTREREKGRGNFVDAEYGASAQQTSCEREEMRVYWGKKTWIRRLCHVRYRVYGYRSFRCQTLACSRTEIVPIPNTISHVVGKLSTRRVPTPPLRLVLFL